MTFSRHGGTLSASSRRKNARRRAGSSPGKEVEVHARPEHARRVRGRDRHPPADDEPGRQRRRRVAAAAFTLPALGFAIAPIFTRQAVDLAADRHPGRLHRDDLRDEGDHDHPGDRRGRQLDRLRPRSATRAIDTEPEDQYNHWIALSDRCMHLGCPVRYVEAAERFICPCHGGVYDFRGMVAGGPPVRPLDRFYTRAQRTASSRSARGTRSTASSSGSRRASRVSRSTASASTCTRPSSPAPRA